MKTELEKKLDKLPPTIQDKDDKNVYYSLFIYKLGLSENSYKWVILYTENIEYNPIIRVEHQSLQAAVDTTLKEIKNI